MASPPDKQPRAAGPPELVGATQTPLTLTGGSATVAISVPSDTREQLRIAGAPGPGRVLVSVDDITAAVNSGIVYGVYLNAPDAHPEGLEYLIGNVSLFGIEKMNDPAARHVEAPGLRHVFDATKVAEKLAREGRWDPANVTVTFEPATFGPPPGQEDGWVRPEHPKAPPIEIGRISVFVE